jgi:gamma-glutamyltranspeptidase/glutathione hydrolase
MAGVGVGARVFDGRLCQPGLATKRPRGFRAGESIPDAARIAVPTSVQAALVALSYESDLTVRSVMKAGIGHAERSGAKSRVELLRRIRAVGAAALQESSFVRPLLHVGGVAEGGLLTQADFTHVRDVDQPAAARSLPSGVFYEPGYAREGNVSADGPIGCALLTIDFRGIVVVASYYRTMSGLLIDDLEVEVPLVAIPVERGVPRVSPGAPLPTPAPIGVVTGSDGVPLLAAAAPGQKELDVEQLDKAPLRVRHDPQKRTATPHRL